MGEDPIATWLGKQALQGYESHGRYADGVRVENIPRNHNVGFPLEDSKSKERPTVWIWALQRQDHLHVNVQWHCMGTTRKHGKILRILSQFRTMLAPARRRLCSLLQGAKRPRVHCPTTHQLPRDARWFHRPLPPSYLYVWSRMILGVPRLLRSQLLFSPAPVPCFTYPLVRAYSYHHRPGWIPWSVSPSGLPIPRSHVPLSPALQSLCCPRSPPVYSLSITLALLRRQQFPLVACFLSDAVRIFDPDRIIRRHGCLVGQPVLSPQSLSSCLSFFVLLVSGALTNRSHAPLQDGGWWSFWWIWWRGCRPDMNTETFT